MKQLVQAILQSLLLFFYTMFLKRRRSLVGTFARFNCLRKYRRAATFLHIISTCAIHCKSFDIITSNNFADGTTSMFVLLIVMGSKGFSDVVNDIPCTSIRLIGNHRLETL